MHPILSQGLDLKAFQGPPKIMSNFYQHGPEISNTFISDKHLKLFFEKNVPKEYHKIIFEHLIHVGHLASSTWLDWATQAESHPPKHIPYSPWGKRIDMIETSEGWKNLEKAAAIEGIVATAFERKQKEFSRSYQMALLYLYSPSSAFYSCPLAMTDGAARALEIYGDPDLKSRAFKNLTSRDPKTFWTSGQWMTERTGGSDVSHTSTIAKKIDQKNFSLSGTKWFTSATTSQMTLTLARPEGAPLGNKGLSLFYLELRDQDNQLNNIEVHRLKEKLGTKALPTAELTMHNTPARLIGGEGDGIKKIASVLNITRVYNSICALGHSRRALDLAWDYARKRSAFGDLIINHPLHQITLKQLENDFKKCFDLTFFVVGLLGKEECGTASELDKKLLRALTPIIKLYTAKKSILISSEVLECFGGAGYIEDTGLPRLLRDAQVFSIWEGTTNVLAMDFLRVCDKEDGLEALCEFLKKKGSTQVGRLMDSKWKESVNARELVFLVAELLAEVL